jgi:hypothetical protein
MALVIATTAGMQAVDYAGAIIGEQSDEAIFQRMIIS